MLREEIKKMTERCLKDWPKNRTSEGGGERERKENERGVRNKHKLP